MNKRITGVYMLAAMISASLLLATALISAVPVHASQNNANGREEPAAKTVNKTPQYTCIHHPDITSDSPSTCPKCLMALIKKSPPKTKPTQNERRAKRFLRSALVDA